MLAGFTLGEADVLRKAMGKKNAEVMADAAREVRRGRAEERASTRRRRRSIFDLMEHFAGYGFNKSHSTAYALLAYQTAYLKANYPWHFAAALLTIEAQNTDKLALYLGECRDRGIPVLPPDINESQLRFTVDAGKGVRFGLTAIKNVGEGAIESLLDGAQRSRAAITSLHALCEDLDLRLVNKRVFESLVKAGAFDSLAPRDRRRRSLPPLRVAAAAARRASMPPCEHGARMQRDRERRAGAPVRRRRAGRRPADDDAADASCPRRRPWTETEQLSFEKETLGLYWSGHPVDRYAADLQGVRRADDRRARPRTPSPSRARATRWGAGPAASAIERGHQRRRHRRRLPAAQDAQGRSRWRSSRSRIAQGGVEVVVFPGDVSARARR